VDDFSVNQDEGALPPIVFAPRQGEPRQLFVLLHDDESTPAQLDALTLALKQAFPQSLVVLPYGPLRSPEGVHRWVEPDGPGQDNRASRIRRALLPLVVLVQRLQRQYDLDSEGTALAGFGMGATLALEAANAQLDLAGRVLAFSGCYAQLPGIAPPATTLHLLHGQEDAIVPVADARGAHAHLADLKGDATLDIASQVGHELHEVLVRQAIYRLQTCVPLRSWQAALGELRDLAAQEPDASSDGPETPPDRTLH